MNTNDDQDDTNDRLESQREIIKASLNEIANDVGMMLRDVGLTFPVYITVRHSSDSLATIATPGDEPDADWSRASEIVCKIIGQKFGGGKLRSRDLLCAVANSRPISAAEVTTG